jgi:hypothetical protein
MFSSTTASFDGPGWAIRQLRLGRIVERPLVASKMR